MVGGEYLSYLKFISEKIVANNAKTVLDVGCGDGRLCNILNSYSKFERIKGIDLSHNAVSWAKMFNPTLEFEEIDVAVETGSYDAVTVIEVIEHIPDDLMPAFWQGLYQVLSGDGRIYMTVPSTNLPLNKKHYRHYDLEMIMEHIKNAGVNLQIESGGYIVPKKTAYDHFVQKIFYNRFWKFGFFDTFEWKRLWRNGLEAARTSGLHCYAIIKKTD